MFNLFNIYEKTMLVEQEHSKLMLLRKSISDRIPITINYKGPSPEVLSGVRYEIEPIVLGNHFRSNNLVFWAYVHKGTSKKGLPNWKMFRVDRVDSVKFNLGIAPFELDNLPGYQKGKAPNLMKSLSGVHIFSPYWNKKWRNWNLDNTKTSPEPEKVSNPVDIIPTPIKKEKFPVENPDSGNKKFEEDIYTTLLNKVITKDGEKTISNSEFESAVKNVVYKKEKEWVDYQKLISGNVRPGEGTRKRFDTESRTNLKDILDKNNVKIDETDLSEIFQKFKKLVFF